MGAWNVPINFDPATGGHTILKCSRSATQTCTGCREDNDGMDCRYVSLSCCSVCNGMEGSLLPFCPGRALSYDEGDRNYKHYCEATGPFARATIETVAAAQRACLAYYSDDIGSMPPARPGAFKLYLSVCDLVRSFPPLDQFTCHIEHCSTCIKHRGHIPFGLCSQGLYLFNEIENGEA